MKLAAFTGGIVLLAVILFLLMAWPFLWICNYAVVSAVTVAKPIGHWVAFWLMLFFSVFIAGMKSTTSSGS